VAVLYNSIFFPFQILAAFLFVKVKKTRPISLNQATLKTAHGLSMLRLME